MEIKIDTGIGKLAEVVASGIGSIAGSWLAPWMAEKESEAKLIEAKGKAKALSIVAQAQKEALDMLGTGGISVKGEIELGKEITQRIDYQERKRQANIYAVVEQAAQRLEGEMVPAIEPNHDWTSRFFREVQDVSSEEMQLLWSKVLAGEVQKPGATSTRTLGILKDLDEETARLFSRFCSAAIYLADSDGKLFDVRVPSLGGHAAQNSIANYGLGFGQLNRLNEHGLIIADYNSYYTFEIISVDVENDKEFNLYHQGITWDWTIAKQGVKGKEVKLHGVAMTMAGGELSRVVTSEPIVDYTEALKKFLLKKFGVEMKQSQAGDATIQG